MEATRRPSTRGNLGGGWSSTRRGTLTIALISAAIAAAILVFALNRYRESIKTAPKSATVLVANRLIEKGTAGAAIGVGRYVRTASISEKQVSSGAIANPSALHGEVAAVDIYPGQQLTAADFVSGGLFYSKLPPNLRAISVPVSTSQGMVGNIQTGDRVDVYVSFPKEFNKPAFVRMIGANVVVLDAGKLSSGAGLASVSTTSQSANVVLEVDARQAADLALAADNGKVWLALSPAHGTGNSNQTIDEYTILAENSTPSSGAEK